MKIPRKLWIGDSEWTVVFLKHIDKNTLGYCDSEKQRIEVLTGLGPRERFATFVHELLHGFEDEYGFEIDHKVLDQLAYAITDFLIDNIE